MNRIGLNSNIIPNFKTNQDAQLQTNPQIRLEQQPLPEVPLPQIYNVPSDGSDEPTTVEKIKKFDMFGIIYPWLEHPFTLLATCTGMAWGLDKFSQACGGDYEKSLVGKAGSLGDSIENSKFVKSKPIQAVLGLGEKAVGKVKHFFRNSDLLNAIFKTPSQPEWMMPKDEMLGMKHRVVHEFNNIAKTLKWTEEGFTKLEDLGLDKDDKKFLKEFFGDTKLVTIEEKASNAVRLNRLGKEKDTIRSIVQSVNATECVKAEELKHVGLDLDFLRKIEKNTPSLNDIELVEKACNKGRNIRIGAGHQWFLGPFQPFERKASLSEISNRLKSMLYGPKTKTGKFIATFLQKCHRGFTFGGHKMNAIFFVSPILVETMMDVKKAEPNEKLGTAAHGLVHSVSWVFTFPLALKLMHHIGGMQYAGMSKEDVAKYRKLISDFNEKANPFEEKSWMNIFGIGQKKDPSQKEFYQSYADYKKGLKELKTELKKLTGKNSKNQNLITKIGKQMAKFLTIDLETISSYKNGSIIGNFVRRIPNFFKNLGGVPMRFILWGAITMGVFDAIINKGIKGCFGNFYDRFKEEEFINAKKEQKKFLKQDLKVRLYEANQKQALGLENSPVMGDFSNENLAKLVPAITRPLSSKKIVNNEQRSELSQKADELSAQGEIIKEDKEEFNLQEKKGVQKDKLVEKPASLEDVNTNEVLDSKFEKETPLADSKDEYTYIPKEQIGVSINQERQKRDNYTYIPSSENVLKKQQKSEEVNKYIPSQIGAKFTKTFDNSGLEAALRRADRAEQRAIQTLAGNFNSY